jgi:hypothetical protein
MKKLEDHPEVLNDLRDLLAKRLGLPASPQPRRAPVWLLWLTIVASFVVFLALVWREKVLR